MSQEILLKLKSVQNQIAKTCFFAGQDHKHGVNHSGWRQAQLHREPKASHSEELGHQVDPKGLDQSHVGEDANGWNEKSNDDPKDVAAGDERKHGSALLLAIIPCPDAFTVSLERSDPWVLQAQQKAPSEEGAFRFS